jgi:hypothetical protein
MSFPVQADPALAVTDLRLAPAQLAFVAEHELRSERTPDWT